MAIGLQQRAGLALVVNRIAFAVSFDAPNQLSSGLIVYSLDVIRILSTTASTIPFAVLGPL